MWGTGCNGRAGALPNGAPSRHRFGLNAAEAASPSVGGNYAYALGRRHRDTGGAIFIRADVGAAIACDGDPRRHARGTGIDRWRRRSQGEVAASRIDELRIRSDSTTAMAGAEIVGERSRAIDSDDVSPRMLVRNVITNVMITATNKPDSSSRSSSTVVVIDRVIVDLCAATDYSKATSIVHYHIPICLIVATSSNI